MACELSDAEIEAILEEGKKALASGGKGKESRMKIDKAIEVLQYTKNVLENQLKRFQEETEVLMAYLVEYAAIKAEASRRMRAMKVTGASLAISLSSLTFGIRCRSDPVMKDALPWAFGLSATSLLFSFINCKGIWSNSTRRPKKKTAEHFVNATKGVPEVSADTGFVESNETDSEEKSKVLQRRAASA